MKPGFYVVTMQGSWFEEVVYITGENNGAGAWTIATRVARRTSGGNILRPYDLDNDLVKIPEVHL